MARNLVLVAFGIVVGVVGAAATGLHAEPDELHAAVAAVAAPAAEAHVDPVDLLGASITTGLPPRTYLQAVGELPMPREPALPPNPRIACIIRVESQGDPNARNRSGASGLGQFLPSTWATTPQGKAGLSVFDAAANRAAIEWMVSVGRAREFDAVRFYGC